MLAEILRSQRAQFTALAEGWLTMGTETFSVWSDGRLLACWPDRPALERPTLIAPIQIGGRIIGELRTSGPHVLLAHARLCAEAGFIAQIIRLEEELERMTVELIDAQDQLLALYDLTQSTRNHLGIVETLRSLACESARLVKAEGAVMILGPTLVHHPMMLIDDAISLNCFRQVQIDGQELVLNGGEVSALTTSLHSLCFLPIRVRGAISAGLALINRLGGNFTAPDLKLARAITEQAGAQIEHALLYQEMLEQTRLQTEMELARNVQRRLLPQRRPQIPGLEMFAESRTAMQVGGDFYDFVHQLDRPLIFLLGDVAGKGISAALIMGMIHSVTYSAARFMPKPTPVSVMNRANEDLYDDFTNLGTFATAFVGQYDAETSTLSYANAGQSPVIFRPSGGPAQLLEADGAPIGVLPMCLCENHFLRFGAGDLLIVATDGLSEASNPSGEMFGYDRMLHLVESLADQPAQVIARLLFDTVDRFAAGHLQDDDRTLIVLKGVPRDH